MPDPVLSVVHVSKPFGALVAVDNISFEVNRGTTVALLGGNGAGKTTTLSMLLGLLLPTAGQINIFGVDVQRQRYRVLPRMNFSSPYVDLPRRLTVRENLTVYAHLYGLRRIRERLRHDPARLAQHVGGRAPVRRRPHAARREARGPGHAGGAADALRAAQHGGGVHRHRARAPPRRRARRPEERQMTTATQNRNALALSGGRIRAVRL